MFNSKDGLNWQGLVIDKFHEGPVPRRVIFQGGRVILEKLGG